MDESDNVVILVTGGCGFIGSHVVEFLVTRFKNWKIINFDKLDYCASAKNLSQVDKLSNYVFVRGDVTDLDFVRHIMQEHMVNVVMHFAAQSHVDSSFKNAIDYTRNNVIGTHVMLEASRMQTKPIIRKFIHVSTDEVYGEISSDSRDCTEEAILAPTNPYSATKAAAECLVRAYYQSFKLPVVITRSNNVYGPRQFPEKIIPKFICSLLQGAKCTLHGDGSHSRRYIYISDVVAAFDKILRQSQAGEIYNIGTDTEISNIEVFQRLYCLFTKKHPECLERNPPDSTAAQSPLLPVWHTQEFVAPINGDTTASSNKFLLFTKDRPFNDSRYAIDSRKLQQFGWQAQVDFATGLEETVEWYKINAWNWWENDALLNNLYFQNH